MGCVVRWRWLVGGWGSLQSSGRRSAVSIRPILRVQLSGPLSSTRLDWPTIRWRCMLFLQNNCEKSGYNGGLGFKFRIEKKGKEKLEAYAMKRVSPDSFAFWACETSKTDTADYCPVLEFLVATSVATSSGRSNIYSTRARPYCLLGADIFSLSTNRISFPGIFSFPTPIRLL